MILDPDFIDAKYLIGAPPALRRRIDSKRKSPGRRRARDGGTTRKVQVSDRYRWRGGTTHTGTISKLSMPGVLLHHETATVDSYHHSLIPWVHYVPVSSDLSDLRERVRWIEEHPEKKRTNQ